jgi:hypothetical protein
MEWARMLAYITGTVDQELLLRNEYLATENRILRAQIKGRLLLSDREKRTARRHRFPTRPQSARGRGERREAGHDPRLVPKADRP